MKKESSNHNPLEITSINELNQNGFVPISRESNLGRLLRLRRFTVLPTVAVLVLLASACGGRGGNDNSLPPESRPSQPPVAGDANRVLPLSGDVFLTQGPHAWDDGNGTKSSLDFAPRRIVDCPAGARITVDEQDAVASVSGTIVVVGDQENRNDQKHSIIEIQEDGTGLRFEHMHLDKFLPNVRIGNKVRARDPIAKPSCEVPKGGRTTGIHEHIDIKDPNGNYIPINGLTFSGWTISGNTMTKPGEETRTADGRRCGPDKASINNCGGIRNDLINVNVKGTVAGPKPPIPPLATPKIGESQTPSQLSSAPDCPSPPGPREIKRGEALRTAICNSGYVDLLFFRGSAGERIILTMQRVSGLLDPKLQIWAPCCVGPGQVAREADSLGSNAASIEYELPYTGIFAIRTMSASGNQTGSYLLELFKK